MANHRVPVGNGPGSGPGARPPDQRGACRPGQGGPRRCAPLDPGGLGGPPRPGPIRWPFSRVRPTSRVQELVPIRYGRMLVSPFTFYRGAALIMASDLSTTPRSGLNVQACGDAHLSNFGVFASAERNLVFDLNDFDETLRGPWEWDVKRLATSLAIAGRDRGFSDKERAEVVLECRAGLPDRDGQAGHDARPRRLVRPHGHREGAGRDRRRARPDRTEGPRQSAGQGQGPGRQGSWPRPGPATACRRWRS